jgi:hypothetical protein
MAFFTKQVRTLLLLAAAVWAVCLLGCAGTVTGGASTGGASTDGSSAEAAKKAPVKAAKKAPAEAVKEATQVLSAFEKLYLAAHVELGDVVDVNQIGFTAVESKWFIYEVSADVKSCTAKAIVDMGEFKTDDYIVTTYNEDDNFIHSSNNEAAARQIFPHFFN